MEKGQLGRCNKMDIINWKQNLDEKKLAVVFSSDVQSIWFTPFPIIDCQIESFLWLFRWSTRFDTVIFLRKKVQGKNRSRNNQWVVWNNKGLPTRIFLWATLIEFQNGLHYTWWKLNIIHVCQRPSIKLSHAAKTIKEVEQILNEERNKAYQWYDKNFLIYGQIISFGPKKKTKELKVKMLSTFVLRWYKNLS